jgi:hypothetical protein
MRKIDPEKRRANRQAYSRDYYLRNKEKHNARSRQWYADHTDEHKSLHKAWYAENSHKLFVKKLLREYGLTLDAYLEMVLKQSGRCASCEVYLTYGVQGAKTQCHVDHNHAKQKGDPGFVRGLLCSGCNLSAGNLLDSPENAEKLAAYLRRTR